MEPLTRPIFNDELLLELSKAVGKEVFEWCSEDTPLEECVSHCKRILKFHSNDNGYELAKEFEYIGYIPDPQLVELLDGVYSTKSDLIRNATKKWVIENKIEPPIGIGTTCIVKYGHKKVEGTITGTYSETAEYQVAIPSEGMPIDGTSRAIIKYEDAELINSPV